MNLQEYNEIKNYDYVTYCNYLLNKYGRVQGDYFTSSFSQNLAIKRRDEELFLHHIKEDTVANLSDVEVAKSNSFDYQKAENLVYANLLEHILLHIIIGEQNKGLGFGGAEIMIAQANDFYADFGEKESVLNDGFEVLELLKERCGNSIAAYETLFEHNQTVFYELEDTLAKNDRALVVIGTGLGKTTTALAYLRKYGIRGIVLGPNRIITDAWAKNNEVDVYTYQWFMNNYKTIDFSKYGALICDEAHHCAAPKWGEGIRYALDNGLIKVMGLTATPKEQKDKKNYETSSQFFEGCVCQGFTVLDGIERGIIHDFSYVGAIYDTSDIREKYSDLSDEKLKGELDLALNNTPTMEEIFRKHLPQSKRKGIVFCTDIKAIDEAEAIMRKVLPNAEFRHMHSLMGAEAEEARKWFEGTDEGWLFAVNMISEGAHYKGVNTIVMFRRTESSLVFNQQLGRIITLARDEDPEAIVFDLVNNANNIAKGKSFASSLKRAYQQRKASGGKQKSEQVIVEDYAEKISEVLGKIAEATSHFWTEGEKEILRQYYAAHQEVKINLTDLLPLLPRHNRTQIISQAAYLGITNNKRLPWTNDEDEILKQNYPIMGSKVSELLPLRSIQSILQRASGLKLKYEVTDRWTEEEKDIIYTYFPIEGIDGVEKRLSNRTKRSIQTMACKMGIVMENPNQNRKGQGHTPIMCLETGIIYDSIADAHEATGDDKSSICECCQRKRYATHGRHYLYASDPKCQNPKKAIEEIETQRIQNNPRNKAVRNIDTDEVFISATEAKKKYPMATKIGEVCKGKRKTTGGYRWEYVEEDA